MEVTARLARFVVATGYDEMSPEVIAAAKPAFLDTLGVALAGSRAPSVGIVNDLVTRLGGTDEASVIGFALRTSAANAALANGVMAHALDYDDDIGVGYGHPSAVLVPTVLALGEALGRSGRDVLAAYVLGVEVWFKVARVMPRLHPLGWHPTGVFGALGAAAAAAKLMRLDADRTTMALGLGGSQAAGLIQNLGTMTKPFHAGNAARSGVVAAMLAADGFTATRAVLEGDLGFPVALCGHGEVDPGAMLRDLGAPFALIRPGINVKQYPCYYSAHKCIDAALHLIERHDIQPDAVASVDCRVPARVAKILFYTEPRTGLEGKFSMQFFMAAALVERSLGLAQFTDAKVNDARIRGLMKRVTMSEHRDWGPGEIPLDHPDIVTVTLKSGTEYRRAVATARGHADNPLTWGELTDKYQACARLAMPEKDAMRLSDMLAHLDELAEVGELMHLLRTAGR
ncbi:MAG: MmgE/PrpD family protein [Betaproteobacteria bacterium]|nr:MAG: MmgE/PrpD family protein [Betaproteobacteria bacterium]